MSTINRTIETDRDRTMAARLIEGRGLPFTLTLTDGKHRTTAQNKLQRLWMNEIAEQKGDMKPEEVRAYCKLTIGVPILRAQNEAFRDGYDRVVKPLPYEQKLAIMAEPLDMPITRLMTTAQKTEYLDGIIKHFAEQGIVLTMPEQTPDGQSPAVGEGSGVSPSSAVTNSEPVGGPEAEEEAPASDEPGKPADGPQAASSSDLDPVKRMLMEECIDNMLRDAFSDPAIDRPAKVDKLREVFLEKQNLGDYPDFVNRCHETARRIIGKPGERDRAKEYLLGKVPE